MHLAGAEFDRLAGEARQRRHRAGHAGRLEQRRIGRDAVEAAQGKPLRPRGAVGGVEQEFAGQEPARREHEMSLGGSFWREYAQDHPSYAELCGLTSIQMYAGGLPVSSGSGDPKLRSSGCGCRIARAPVLAVSPTFSRRWANILISSGSRTGVCRNLAAFKDASIVLRVKLIKWLRMTANLMLELKADVNGPLRRPSRAGCSGLATSGRRRRGGRAPPPRPVTPPPVIFTAPAGDARRARRSRRGRGRPPRTRARSSAGPARAASAASGGAARRARRRTSARRAVRPCR